MVIENPPGTGGFLSGHNVLITGGSSGIGRAIALGFAAHGAHVAVHYHRGRDRALKVVREIEDGGGQALAVGADLVEPSAAAELVDEGALRMGGRLHVVVNSAGALGRRAAFVEIAPVEAAQLFDLNVFGLMNVCRAAVPLLRATAGAIVNISSTAADNGGGPGASVYAATKGAVNALTRALAKELAPSGVRVNTLSPGPTVTAMHDADSEEVRAAVAASVPLGRMAHPGEMVGAALLLASAELGGFITGAVVAVNGGSWFS